MDIPQIFCTYRIQSVAQNFKRRNMIYYMMLCLSLLKSIARNLSSQSKMFLLFHGSVLCCNALLPLMQTLCSQWRHNEYKEALFFFKHALKLLLKFFYSKSGRQDYTYRYLIVLCTYVVQKYVGSTVAPKCWAEMVTWF